MLENLKSLTKKWLTPSYDDNKVKTAFIIWGCNDFAARLHELLENSSADIIGFIDNSKNSPDFFCEKPVYSTDNFKKKDLAHIPIIVASKHDMRRGIPAVDFESVYQFKLAIQQICTEYGIENHLLHPCALIDFVHVEYPNKVIPFGLPGSGITLFSHICTKIIENNKYHYRTKPGLEMFFEKMCFEYTQLMHQILPDTLHAVDGFNFHMSSWKIGSTYAICTIKEARTEIYSFSTRNHVIGPVYNFHLIPSENYLNGLIKQKYQLFFNMRNPLDIIVSCLNKSVNMSTVPQKIDIHSFCALSRWIIFQLTSWTPLIKKLTYFSYDKLVQNPINEIKNVMQTLGLRPSTRLAKQIWKELAYKQLSTAPKDHFWKGGIGKWETYFKKEHLSFLKYIGIEKILEQYNDLGILQKFKEHTAGISETDWQSTIPKEILSKPIDLWGDEKYDTGLFLKNIHGESNFLGRNNLYVIGKDLYQNENVQTAINNKFLNKMVLAGAHEMHRII